MTASGSGGADRAEHRLAELGGVRVAVRRIARHRPCDDRREVGRQAIERRRGGATRLERARQVRVRDGRRAGEHLVQDRAKGPDIRSRRDRVTEQALRRRVAERPDHRRGRRQVAIRRIHQRGDPEIDQVDRPVIVDQDVAGLDIAMDDPVVVRDGERVGDDAGDRDRLARGQRTAGDAFVERPALDEVHDQRRRVRVLDQLARPDDRRVVHRAHGDRFAFQPGPGRRIGDDVRVQSLDGHDLARPLVPRTPDRRHAPARVPVEQSVATGDEVLVHPPSTLHARSTTDRRRRARARQRHRKTRAGA